MKIIDKIKKAYNRLFREYNTHRTSPSESDLHISVEKLRDILMDMADGDGLGYMFETPDEIINRVKKEI